MASWDVLVHRVGKGDFRVGAAIGGQNVEYNSRCWGTLAAVNDRFSSSSQKAAGFSPPPVTKNGRG